MISCPHSIYFFRGEEGDFRYFFADDYKGEKTGAELNAYPNPLLDLPNEGDFYRVKNDFTVTQARNFNVPAGKRIKAGNYVQVMLSGNPAVYKFVLFDGKVANTLIDWGIVPLNLPVIDPPSQKLHTIEIPGMDGLLDISNSLTKYPVFENRTGSLKFAIHHGMTDTNTAYSKILNFLQGVDVKMILEDDSKFFYKGRVFVDSIDPKNDGTYSEVSLGYSLHPYKESIYSSVDDWLWDPFNFETDVIQDSIFYRIDVHAEDPNATGWVEFDFTSYVGQKPVKPEFVIQTLTEGDNLYAQVWNTDIYGKVWHGDPNNNVYVDSQIGKAQAYSMRDSYSNDGYEVKNRQTIGETYRDLIFCEYTPDSELKMRFAGHGYVTIKFRSGRL